MRRRKHWGRAVSGLLLLLASSSVLAVGGTVDGLARIAAVNCDNNSTGQRIRVYPSDNSYDCAASGLQVSAGDFIVQSIRGEVGSNNTGIKGSVSGLTKMVLLYCQNLSTRQRTWRWYPPGSDWSCSGIGLRAYPGQQIEVKLWGYAQGPVPPAPSGFIAKAGVGEVVLSWNAVADAIQYNIYMSTAPGLAPTRDFLLTSVATNEYAVSGLANGATYNFIVTAINAYGEGAPSSEVSATPGFFDHNAVIGQPCAQCHDNINAIGKPPIHPLTTNACEACHTTDSWSPLIVPFDHSQTTDLCARCHNGSTATSKPATHPITTNQCEACHLGTSWLPLITPFSHTETTDACAHCHDGVIATGKGPLHIATTLPCDTCHNTVAFRPVFNHSSVAGQSCAQLGCHDGSSTLTSKPATHPLTSNVCEACHMTSAWLPLIVPFDHSQVLGNSCQGAGCHSLPGGHCSTAEDCSVCHTTTNWLTTLQDCAVTSPPPPPPPTSPSSSTTRWWRW